MAILLDTNILLRTVQKQNPHNIVVSDAIDTLVDMHESLCFTHQNIVEFCAVSTRPLSVNGLGLSVRQAMEEIEAFKAFFNLPPERPLHAEWERLVQRYKVSGKNVHDARLVAARIVHGVDRILTFNTQDFQRYSEIQVLDPAQLV